MLRWLAWLSVSIWVPSVSLAPPHWSSHMWECKHMSDIWRRGVTDKKERIRTHKRHCSWLSQRTEEWTLPEWRWERELFSCNFRVFHQSVLHLCLCDGPFLCRARACECVFHSASQGCSVYCADGASSFPLYLYISSSLSTVAGGNEGWICLPVSFRSALQLLQPHGQNAGYLVLDV